MAGRHTVPCVHIKHGIASIMPSMQSLWRRNSIREEAAWP